MTTIQQRRHSSPSIKNKLTIDVEDYFHVSAFENNVCYDRWASIKPRVENNVIRLLDILGDNNARATFFILGWVAEHFPQLVKNIDRLGHEIACHSYSHRLIYNLTPNEFKKDTQKAKDILEQLIGKKVKGYRAPSYSITPESKWAFDILEELDFEYDSSVFPIHHDRYGMPHAPRFKYKIPERRLTEYPLSTIQAFGHNIPVAGGGYFRFFPYWFTKKCLQRINRVEGKPFIFYLHPWEIDPGQPKIKSACIKSRFRHYLNLNKTEKRFAALLKDFSFTPISSDFQ